MFSLFFFLFSNKLEFKKAQKVHLFTILKTSRFLRLRYSADVPGLVFLIEPFSAVINFSGKQLEVDFLFLSKFSHFNKSLILCDSKVKAVCFFSLSTPNSQEISCKLENIDTKRPEKNFESPKNG